MLQTAVIFLILLSQTACTSTSGASAPPAVERAVPVRGIFAEPALPDATRVAASIPPRPLVPIVETCADGRCALPVPSTPADPFASTPTGFDWPDGLLVPSGGNVSLQEHPNGAIFGRAWQRDGSLRGVGMGLEHTTRRGWRASTEVGVAPGDDVVVAVGLSRRH
ncbi:MAG: hypothetical protein QNJ98_04435 [Planctomycetota bacterium]|nr:hypothetical protein [Planctomycetota bacterium]